MLLILKENLLKKLVLSNNSILAQNLPVSWYVNSWVQFYIKGLIL